MKFFGKAAMATTGLVFAGCLIAASTAEDEARVTRIIRDVKIVPPQSEAEPAVINATVQENTGVRTGDRSRSELTFADLTITRLGANTLFHFNHAGRTADMGSGSMLLRVPKDSGGATINGSAVTVAITGTTVIFRGNRAGWSNLVVMEGGARAQLKKYPRHSEYVRAGQMLDVKAGATRLPKPVNVDLRRIMKTNPLITDFPPLPSQSLILAVIRDQESGAPGEPVYPGRPVGGHPPRGVVGGGAGFGGGGHPPGRPATSPRPSGPGGTVVNPKNPKKPRKPTTQTSASSYSGKRTRKTVTKPTSSYSGKRTTGRRRASPTPTPSGRVP